MTKALFINGSPRKNGNTAQLLKRAMDGGMTRQMIYHGNHGWKLEV